MKTRNFAPIRNPVI